MTYAEASFFDRNHCQHCAARDEAIRLQRIKLNIRQAMHHRTRHGLRLV